MFEGIKISCTRLIAETTVMTLLLVAVIAIGVVGYILLHSDRDTKREAAITNLRLRAESDERAAKRLKKLERQNKRRFMSSTLEIVIAYILLAAIALATLALLVIPGWLDITKQDHVVYKGFVEVEHQSSRKSGSIISVELNDGTTLSGFFGDFPEGRYYVKLVYSRRTKFVLGRS